MYFELARATIRDLQREAALASTALAAHRKPGQPRRLVNRKHAER